MSRHGGEGKPNRVTEEPRLGLHRQFPSPRPDMFALIGQHDGGGDAPDDRHPLLAIVALQPGAVDAVTDLFAVSLIDPDDVEVIVPD